MLDELWVSGLGSGDYGFRYQLQDPTGSASMPGQIGWFERVSNVNLTWFAFGGSLDALGAMALSWSNMTFDGNRTVSDGNHVFLLQRDSITGTVESMIGPSNARWVLKAPGLTWMANTACENEMARSCSDACAAEQQICEPSVLRQETTQQKVSKAASIAGLECKSFEVVSDAPDNWVGPTISRQNMCEYTTNEDWAPPCSAPLPSIDCETARLCPCVHVFTFHQWGYDQESGQACGKDAQCGTDNDVFIGQDNMEFDEADDPDKCKDKCSRSPYCRGFDYDSSAKKCYYKKQTNCGQEDSGGHTCWTKRPAPLLTPRPTLQPTPHPTLPPSNAPQTPADAAPNPD